VEPIERWESPIDSVILGRRTTSKTTCGYAWSRRTGSTRNACRSTT